MKQGVLYSFICAAAFSTVTVLADHLNTNFEGWTHNDLKQYVQDHEKNLNKLGSKTLEELKEQLSKSWAHDAQPKPWWQIWPSDDKYSWDSSTPVSDWLFDTWSKEDLHKLLDKYNVDFDAKATKDGLVKVAKDNFKQISKSLDSSGYYPSSGYFQDWSLSDLKNWLNQYDIPYDKVSENKEELLDRVRENLYHASKLTEEKKSDFFKSLDLANKQVLDKAGKVKDDIFNSWSTEDLTNWLKSHQVAVNDKVAENRDELIKSAKKNAALFKDDVDWYLESLRKKSTPYISKSPEYVASVWDSTMSKLGNLFSHLKGKTDDAINDTFLVGLDDWSRDRLKTYLDLRGVKYHLLATNNQLRKLALEARNKPLKDIKKNYDKLTEGITYDNMKNWAQDKSDQIQDTDIYNSVSDGLDSLNKDTQKWATDFTKKWSDSLNSWSVDDLNAYLKSFGVQTTTLASLTKDDLVKTAKLKTQMFLGTFQEPWYSRWIHNGQYWFKHPLSLFF